MPPLPKRRLIGKQPGPAELYPEVELVDSFGRLDLPRRKLSLKGRKAARVAVFPRLYAVVGVEWENEVAVISTPPRLTLKEAMRDARREALKERRHWAQVAKELGDLPTGDEIGDVTFMVAQLTTKGLKRLSAADNFGKFLSAVKKLQTFEKRRFIVASLCLHRRLPAPVANGVMKFW